MANPKAVIAVSNGRVSFRLQYLRSDNFRACLDRIRASVPGMRWNEQDRAWQVNPYQFQQLYEACRTQLGPSNTKVFFTDPITAAQPVQLSLFSAN